nr:hypothetical protein GCM10020092_048750 [Actinoplanes digitatis]
MRTFTKRSVKLAIGLPAAIAVSAGIGLAATTVDLAASPRAAAAATGAASDAGHRRDHIPKRLKDSLLAVSDLSSGYSALMEPSPSDATAFDDACAMWEGDSEDASQPLGRLTAVKKDDDSAIVMFTNDSLVVVEHIAVIGEDKAQAVVDGFAEAPERCPVITTGEGDDKVRVTQSPLTVPDLGDASAEHQGGLQDERTARRSGQDDRGRVAGPVPRPHVPGVGRTGPGRGGDDRRGGRGEAPAERLDRTALSGSRLLD